VVSGFALLSGRLAAWAVLDRKCHERDGVPGWAKHQAKVPEETGKTRKVTSGSRRRRAEPFKA